LGLKAKVRDPQNPRVVAHDAFDVLGEAARRLCVDVEGQRGDEAVKGAARAGQRIGQQSNEKKFYLTTRRGSPRGGGNVRQPTSHTF